MTAPITPTFSDYERALAKALYDAYRAHTGGVSAVTGQAIPEWTWLPVHVQGAWCASAREAVRRLGPAQGSLLDPPRDPRRHLG
jgi:hypothetical protein